MIPTRRHLEYASGYLALGMIKEAAVELEAIAGEDRQLPAVMSVRSDLYMEARQWDPLLVVSRELARQRPRQDKGWIGWAFALRELNRVEDARQVLLEAEPVHGKKCALLHYNLACYYCLLGDQTEAKTRLARACQMDPAWRLAALDDEDLKPLRAYIAAMK